MATETALEREDRRELGNPAAGRQQWPSKGQLLGLERPVLEVFDVVERRQSLENGGLAGSGRTDENEGDEHLSSIPAASRRGRRPIRR